MKRAKTAAQRQASLDFSRAVMVYCCKDGTITFCTKDQPKAIPESLPVFSVDTFEQAYDLRVTFCRKQYIKHPDIPNEPWYRWTDFPGTIDALDEVRERCRLWWYGRGEGKGLR